MLRQYSRLIMKLAYTLYTSVINIFIKFALTGGLSMSIRFINEWRTKIDLYGGREKKHL